MIRTRREDGPLHRLRMSARFGGGEDRLGRNVLAAQDLHPLLQSAAADQVPHLPADPRRGAVLPTREISAIHGVAEALPEVGLQGSQGEPPAVRRLINVVTRE